MIEVTTTYDLLPNIDHQAYGELTKNITGAMVKSPGFVELRAHRNLLGSPQVRTTSLWKTLADWANFNQSAGWQAFEAKARAFTTDIHTQLWGPSPLLPEPLRASQ